MISKKKLLMSYYLRSEGESYLNKTKHQRQTQIMIMSYFCIFLIFGWEKFREEPSFGTKLCFFFCCSTVVWDFYCVIYTPQLPFCLAPSPSQPSQCPWWVFALEKEQNISRQSLAGIPGHTSDGRRVLICISLQIQCIAGCALSSSNC